MSKAKIIDKKSIDSILGEKFLLSELHHPFIVNMIYSFQDHDYLYLVMDLLPGGNLRYHITMKRRFNEKQNKFLIGCILVGLEYLHGENILHRDIKPENLVFDNNGYLRITDFGIAKKYIVNNKKDTSGTVGYLAPEVLCNQNHNFSIDYYAVGIITFELAFGRRPYIGKTKHDVKQLIISKQVQIDYDDLPNGYQNEAADFINKLIQRKPQKRLGNNSIKEVIGHPWFKGFDWEKMKNKSLKAYYIPKEGDNYDKKYCLQSNRIGTDTIIRYKQITNEPNYEIIFKNFDCEKIPDELKIISNKNKYGDTINNAANNSSNNSTTSVSRNNKIIFNNDNNKNNKKNKNTISLLGKNKNKSLENIFSNQNKEKNNILKNQTNKIKNKSLNKQISAIDIKVNNENIISVEMNKESIKNKENLYHDKNTNNNSNINNDNIVTEKGSGRKKYKIIYNKKNEDNNTNKYFSYKKYKSNEGKEILKLKETQNNFNNNHNISQKNSNNIKEKNTKNQNLVEINSINNNSKITNKNLNKDKESIIVVNNSYKISNLNNNISNNFNQKPINKSNKLLSNSISAINILSNGLFANIKGNYFKKIINNKKSKRNKNNNNSLIASNSTKSLFKNNSNSNLSKNYLSKAKKNFLKKELFTGTFYPNKSVSTKYFLINSNKNYKKRKSSSYLINKNKDLSNKRLTSSSSMHNIMQHNDKEGEDISGIFKKKDLDINSNEIKKFTQDFDKNLPFINISLNKKSGNIFRSNLHLLNRNNNRNHINSINGFFSQRLNNNENKKMKNAINGNILNKK